MEESTMKTSQQQHIRPKVRSRPVEPSAPNSVVADMDTMQDTRERLRLWTAVSSRDEAKNVSEQQQTTTVVHSSKVTPAPKESDAPKPKSILRAPKYSSNDPNTESLGPVAGDEPVERGPCSPAAVKDIVVERDPVVHPQNVISSGNAHSVEGYTPCIATKEPMVFSSLSDLLEQAGALPDQAINHPTKVVEADLAFSCMTAQEYEETVEQADERRNDKEDTESGSDTDKECKTDDEDTEDDDEEDFDPLCSFDGDGESEEEAMPEQEPRAFLRIWMALKDWITPETVALIQQWRHVDSPQPLSTDWAPQVDRSDLGASRCAGLMSLLKMHLLKCLEELGHSPDEKRRAATRLADFLRTFDYSRPMAKLDTPLWKTMTCIMLDTVLMDAAKASKQVDTLPASVDAVGMTKDEYIYLTRSAVTSLG